MQNICVFLQEFGIRQFLLKNLYWKFPGELGFRFNLEVLKTCVGAVGEAYPQNCKVSIPTLFIRGDRSEYISLEDEKQISNQFLNYRLKTISNAGHWLHAENPEAFYTTVFEFLS